MIVVGQSQQLPMEPLTRVFQQRSLTSDSQLRQGKKQREFTKLELTESLGGQGMLRSHEARVKNH